PSPPERETRRAVSSRRASREQRLPRIVVGLLLQFLEQLALALLQPFRNGDLHAREHVTAAGALQLRRALALDAEQRPVLGAALDLQSHRPIGRRRLNLGAERRLREGDRQLDDEVDAAALALRADRRRRAGLGARAVALRAGRLQRDRDLRLHPLQRVLEREVDDDFEVVAAARLRPLSAARAAAPAEDAPEQVAEVPEIPQVEVLEVDVASAEAAASVRGAEGVVLLPLLGIREQVVRALDLLEPLLGGRVAGVAVRVVLARELAVGLLDLLGARVLRDAEDLVWVTRLRSHNGASLHEG